MSDAPKLVMLELERHIQNREFLVEMINQINKDAELSGLDFGLNAVDHHNYPTIHAELVSFIDYCIPDRIEQLTRLCYRMDVGEKVLKELFNPEHMRNLFVELADAIILREMKKVVLRNQLK